jgi:hypothetical protein
MPKNEKAEAASSKPNRGQDEILHTVTTPTGETIQVTQRDWKENYRGVEGYTRNDAENEPEAVPAVEDDGEGSAPPA